MHKYILILFIGFLILPGTSSAGIIDLNLDYPEFGNIVLDKETCKSLPADKECGQSLNVLIAWIYYAIVGLSGLAAFVMLVWGGIQWLVSGAAPGQASEARDRIKSAVLGLLLILASVLIIQVINPELTVLKLPGLEGGKGSTPTLDELEGGGGGGTLSLSITPTVAAPGDPINITWSTLSEATSCEKFLDPDPGGITWGPGPGANLTFDPADHASSGMDSLTTLPLGAYKFILNCDAESPLEFIVLIEPDAVVPPTLTLISLTGSGIDSTCTEPESILWTGGELTFEFAQTNASTCKAITGPGYYDFNFKLGGSLSPPPATFTLPLFAGSGSLDPPKELEKYWSKIGLECENGLGTAKVERAFIWNVAIDCQASGEPVCDGFPAAC